MIIPDGHDKNHALLQSSSHGSKASLGLELVLITKGSLLCITEGVADGVAFNSSDGGLRVRDDNTILDIEPFDLAQGSGGSSIVRDELCDDSKLGAGIDGLAFPIKAGCTHAVRVEIASISIAEKRVSCVDSTVCSRATSLSSDRARVTRIF